MDTHNAINVNIYDGFPKKEISFIDLSPSLADGKLLLEIIEKMSANIPDDIDFIISPESRGFIFGVPVAATKKVGFLSVRKSGKYPQTEVSKVMYKTEYSEDVLEVITQDLHCKKLWFVDDIFATGGTYRAINELVTKLGGTILGGSIVYDIEINNPPENFYFAYNKNHLNIIKRVNINEKLQNISCN